MKKQKSYKKSKKGIFIGILIAVAVLVAVLWIGIRENTTSDFISVDYKMDNNLSITHLGSYSGPYMEDASREEVTDILTIVLTNTGERTLQYAEITLFSEEDQAVFKVSTLKPGETVHVLESERKTFHKEVTYTEASMKNVVYFDDALNLYEDTFKIQALEGGFNITNISEKDISGEIMVYFKDIKDDVLMGGITFRGKIENGLKAGEIKQIMAKNFSKENTKVVFITITEK